MKVKDNIFSLITFIFAFVLPLNTKLANICLLVLGGVAVIKIIKGKCFFDYNILLRGGLRTTMFIVLLLMIGLFYTDDIPLALSYFERYSSYLIIPLVFSFLRLKDLESIRKYSFNGLILGSIVSSIILLTSNFYKYYIYKGGICIDTDLFNYHFTYHKFASTLDFHPTFLGIYFVFTFVVLHESTRWFSSFWKFIISLLLVVCLVFLNSRVAFLLIIIYFIFFGVRLFLKYQKIENGSIKFTIRVAPILLSFFVIIFCFKNTYIYQRMSDQLIWELTENKGTSFDGVYSSDSRVARWEAIVRKSFERPLFGFGSASENRVVIDVYRENDLQYALANKYGPHNQYLSFLLEYGIFGVILFLYYFLRNIFDSIRSNNVTSTLFFIFMMVACIFDSLLYLNAGVIFFAFFGNMFTIELIKKRDI